jgi:phosphatidylglycerophosphatase C
VKKKLVLFDFDGTITTKDTLLEFIRYYHGSFRFLLGFAILSPIIILHLLRVIPNWRAKELVLIWFFKNERLDHFNKICKSFSIEKIPALLRPQALIAIQQHQKNNEEITVISASAENWVKPWCDTLNLNCIATRLEVVNDKLTGRILDKNCYGEEKVVRLKKHYDPTLFSITAYGDSAGDHQMLALADEQFYKPFRK